MISKLGSSIEFISISNASYPLPSTKIANQSIQAHQFVRKVIYDKEQFFFDFYPIYKE